MSTTSPSLPDQDRASGTRADAGHGPGASAPCFVCRSTRIRPAFRSGGYQISRCDDCSHLYVSDPVSQDDLSEAYGRDYYEPADSSSARGYEDYLGKSELRMRGFRQRLMEVERHRQDRGRLLDYGCAVGLFVKVAADAGWNATGFDRSEWAAEYGRKTLGLDIVVGDGKSDPFGPGAFEVVTMWDVLEHLESPRDVLTAVAGWLVPGGLLALNTVNSSSLGARLAGTRWRHLAPPMHLQYFTRHSLERLLAECGFRMIHRVNHGVMLGGARRTGELSRPLSWIEGAATHWRARGLATQLNLLDEIDIVAVKC